MYLILPKGLKFTDFLNVGPLKPTEEELWNEEEGFGFLVEAYEENRWKEARAAMSFRGRSQYHV